MMICVAGLNNTQTLAIFAAYQSMISGVFEGPVDEIMLRVISGQSGLVYSGQGELRKLVLGFDHAHANWSILAETATAVEVRIFAHLVCAIVKPWIDVIVDDAQRMTAQQATFQPEQRLSRSV